MTTETKSFNQLEDPEKYEVLYQAYLIYHLRQALQPGTELYERKTGELYFLLEYICQPGEGIPPRVPGMDVKP